jgi:hypothetical protein
VSKPEGVIFQVVLMLQEIFMVECESMMLGAQEAFVEADSDNVESALS